MDNQKDADRYRKLRALMSANMEPVWEEVCNLAAVGCYVGNDDFDKYLDLMNPETGKAPWEQDADKPRLIPVTCGCGYCEPGEHY